jgi:hypothetical protein
MEVIAICEHNTNHINAIVGKTDINEGVSYVNGYALK